MPQYGPYNRSPYTRTRSPYDRGYRGIYDGQGMGPAISPPREPIGGLATRKFQPTDIIERLVANTDRYDKTPVEREDSFDRDSNEPNTAEWDELARVVNNLRNSRGDKGPDLAKYEGMPLDIKEAEPNIFWKALDAVNKPLSGGYFGRKARENSLNFYPESEKEELFKATGKGDLQDWLAWGEATGKGMYRGMFEGAGDLADEMTSPANLVGLAAGGGALGAAYKGMKGANALRRITQAAGVPMVLHGGKGMIESGGRFLRNEGDDWENAKQFGGSTFEALMGGAQMHFPAQALTSMAARGAAARAGGAGAGAIPKAPPPSGPPPGARAIGPAATTPIRPQGPEPAFGGEAQIQRGQIPPGGGGLNRQEIRPIRSYQERGIAEDFDQSQGVDLDLELARQKHYPAAIPEPRVRPETQAPPPEAAVQEAAPQSEIERMMVGREPGTRLDLGVQESPLVDPNARIEELYAKGNNLTPAESAELDLLIDSQKEKPLTEKLKDLFKPGPEGETGSYDPNWLDKMRRRARMRGIGGVKKGEAPEAGRFPGEQAEDIGAVPEQEIDLEQALLEAGSEMAKPIPPKRPGLLEDEAGAVGPGDRKPGAETFQQFIQRKHPNLTWEKFRALPEDVQQRAAEMYRKSQSEATAAAPPKLIKPGGETVEAQAKAAGIGQVEQPALPPAPVEKPAKAAKAKKPLQETLKEIYPEEKAAPTTEPVVMGGESRIPPAGLDPEAAFGPQGDVTAIRKQKELLDRGNASDVKYKALLPKALHGKLAKGETHRSRLNQLLDATAPITPEQEAKFNADYEARQIEKKIPETFEESIEEGPPGPSSGLRAKDVLKPTELKQPPKKMKPRSKIWGGTKNWFRQFKDEDKGEIDIDVVLDLIGGRRKPKPEVGLEERMQTPGMGEFSPDLRQFDESIEGGTSPEFKAPPPGRRIGAPDEKINWTPGGKPLRHDKLATARETEILKEQLMRAEGPEELNDVFRQADERFREIVKEMANDISRTSDSSLIQIAEISPEANRKIRLTRPDLADQLADPAEIGEFTPIEEFIDQKTSLMDKIKNFMADEEGSARFPRFRDMSFADADIIRARTDLRQRLIDQWKGIYPDWKKMSRQEKIASQKEWLTANSFLSEEGGLNPKWQAQMELEYYRPADMGAIEEGVEGLNRFPGYDEALGHRDDDIITQALREELSDEEPPVHQPDEYEPLEPNARRDAYNEWEQKQRKVFNYFRDHYGDPYLSNLSGEEYLKTYNDTWLLLNGEEATPPPSLYPPPNPEATGGFRPDEFPPTGTIEEGSPRMPWEQEDLPPTPGPLDEVPMGEYTPEMIEKHRQSNDGTRLWKDHAAHDMMMERYGLDALRAMPIEEYTKVFDDALTVLFGEDSLPGRAEDPFGPKEVSADIQQMRHQAVLDQMRADFGDLEQMSLKDLLKNYEATYREIFGEAPPGGDDLWTASPTPRDNEDGFLGGGRSDDLSGIDVEESMRMLEGEGDPISEARRTIDQLGEEAPPRESEDEFATRAQEDRDQLRRDEATVSVMRQQYGNEFVRDMSQEQFHDEFNRVYKALFKHDREDLTSDVSRIIPPEAQALADEYGKLNYPPEDDPLQRNADYSNKVLDRDRAARIEMGRVYGVDTVNQMPIEQYWEIYDEVHNEMFGESPKPTPKPTEAERNLFDERMDQRRGILEKLRDFMGGESGEAEVPDWAKRVAGYTGEQTAPSQLATETGGAKPPGNTGTAGGGLIFGEGNVPKGVPVDKQKVQEYTPSMARQVWDMSQSFMSVDLPYMTSAAFRQASPLAWTDEWFKAWGKASEAFGSKEAYDAIMKNIMDSEFFVKRYKPVVNSKGKIVKYKEIDSIAEEIGVRMSDVNNLINREETLRGALAEKVPIYGEYIRKSNRAYTAFLNSLRKAKLEQMMRARDWSGVGDNMVVAKQIAEFINDATGRSSLKMKTPLGEVNAEKNANALAMALWSPRLIASRMKFLNPMTYMGLDPQVRKEYLTGLFRTLGTWGAFAGLAKMMGAEVSMDPRSSDFGKIKIGNTRIDPGSGFQQLLVFGARMGTGQFVSSQTGKKTEMGEGFKPRTRRSTAEEFMASKLHPSAKLAWDLLGASQSSPVHVGDRIVQHVLPMMAQDMWEVFQSDPELAPLLGALSSIGMGTANYGRSDEYGAPVFTDEIEEAFGLPHRGTFTAGTIGGKRRRSY